MANCPLLAVKHIPAGPSDQQAVTSSSKERDLSLAGHHALV